MRSVFYVLIILTNLAAYSQDFKYFGSNNKLDWNQFESDSIYNELLLSNYEQLKNNPYPEIEYIIKNKDKYHLVDLDNDNEEELIYNGWNGGEGEMVVIYKLNQGKYDEHQRFFGRIVDIKKTKFNRARLIVYDYACCAGYVDHIETFDFNPSTNKFEIEKSTAKIDETSMPSVWIDPVRFEIQNTPYNLRFSPEIITDLQKDSFDFNPIDGQNIIASYKFGDKGVAYAEATDSTGRVWWFVVMDSIPDEGESLFYDGNNEFEDYRPTGWISSRYLKIIE